MKGDQPRNPTHAYADYVKNTARINHWERVTRDDQTLSPEETEELNALKSSPDGTLNKDDMKRFRYLTRVAANGQVLTSTEVRYYQQNLKTREVLNDHLNVYAVASGARRLTELNKVRVHILRDFAATPEAEQDKNSAVIRAFLTRVPKDKNVDAVELTVEAEQVADRVFYANPEAYSKYSFAQLNGHVRQVSEESFGETRELVDRYRILAPHLAPKEEQSAWSGVQDLRRDIDAFNILISNPTPEQVAALPDAYQKVFNSGKLTARVLSLASVHDKRVLLYGLYAKTAFAGHPLVYKRSGEVEPLDGARAVVPEVVVNEQPERSARKQALVDWEARIRSGQWVSREETVFESTVLKPRRKASVNPSKSEVNERLSKPAADTSAAPVKKASVDPSTEELNERLGKTPPSVSTPVSPEPVPVPTAPSTSKNVVAPPPVLNAPKPASPSVPKPEPVSIHPSAEELNERLGKTPPVVPPVPVKKTTGAVPPPPQIDAPVERGWLSRLLHPNRK